MVDPHTGTWYTVGDNGAEFVDIPKDSIVFNHLQTESLLENGYAIGRAVALASGTALAPGKETKLSGHIKQSQALKSHTPTYTGGGNSNKSGGSSGKTSNKSTNKSTSSTTEKDKETFDFIEIAISRAERAIEKLRTTASNVYKTFSKRNAALKDEMTAVTKEIKSQEKAYDLYKKKANSVDLSSDLKTKVREGAINKDSIKDYDDDTAAKIREYQEWYEKMIACKDAVRNLKVTLSDLAKEKFDNTVQKWENKVLDLEHAAERTESKISRRTEKNGDYASYKKGRKASRNNIKDYNGLITNAQDQLKIKKKEKKDLQKQLNEALKKGPDKGGVAKGSEAYFDMLNQIYDVENEIDSLNEDIVDFTNSISEEYSKMFDSISSEYDDKLEFNEQLKADAINEQISKRTNRASQYRSYETGREASKQNIDDYHSLISNAQDQIKVREKERADLQKILQEGLDTGQIEQGGKEYYDMLRQIQAVNNEINSLNGNIIDYANSISEAYVDAFNSVADEYANKLALADQLSKEYQSSLEIAEAQGYIASTKYYEMMRDQELSNISVLQEELQALSDSLYSAVASGEIEVGSSAWYDMSKQICDVKNQINEANKAVIEFNNSIREIDWQHFDYMEDRISKLTDESNFLIDLMSNDKMFDDKGQFTNEGLATLGLHGMNYNTLMLQADDYAAEIEKINKEMADDPSNTKLIERKDELIQKQRESILAAEQEKQAMKELVADGIDAELDSLKELIDKYKDSLDSAKDLYDFQKKLKDQTKNIASLQKQLSAYQNDVSEETKAKIQKIKVQLEEAESNLQDTMYDRYVSEQKKLLDELYNDYEKFLNERLDDMSALMIDMVATVNQNAGQIGVTLSEKAASVGTTLSESMSTIWSPISDTLGGTKNVIDTYGKDFSGKMTTLNGAVGNIKSGVDALIVAANARAQAEKERLEYEKEQNDKKLKEAEEEGNKNREDGNTGQGAADDANDNPPATVLPQTPSDNGGNQGGNNGNGGKGNVSDEDEDIPVEYDTTEVIIDEKKPKKKKNQPKKNQPAKKNTKKTTQGDGKIQVGDQVTFKSGRYYYSPDAQTPTGYQYLGKKVYVTKINTASWATKPYHISVGKTLGSGDLGWLTKSQLSGYASGAKSVNRDEVAWTNERWDKGGGETILRKSDKAVLTPFTGGGRVYSALASDNLWAMANNPGSFILDNLAKEIGNITGSSAGNVGGNEINQDIGGININIDEVTDLDSLLSQMQKSKGFERLVQAMTVDPMLGKSVSEKRRFNFKRG